VAALESLGELPEHGAEYAEGVEVEPILVTPARTLDAAEAMEHVLVGATVHGRSRASEPVFNTTRASHPESPTHR
jgi:hypothetical protein